MHEEVDYIGVDWSSGSWLAVGIAEDRTIHVSTYKCIQKFWDTFGCTAEKVVADIPIGLFEEGDRDESEELVRECDHLARKVVGSRYRSVFNPPAREVATRAKNESYEQVKATNREITGKGLTQQAYSVAPGIAEVDELLEGSEKKFIEGHPEVCFAALRGPLSYSKKTAAGVHERVEALEEVEEAAFEMIREICRQVADAKHEIGVDDALDALVLAYVAGFSEKKQYTLPEDPPKDSQGQPMQMVYRADEPFDTSQFRG